MAPASFRHLQLVRAALGLASGAIPGATFLRDVGYGETIYAYAPITVLPMGRLELDVVTAASSIGHVLLWEAKHPPVSQEQAQKLAAVTPYHLRDTLYLPVDVTMVESDVVYLTSEATAAQVVEELRGYGFDHPVVEATDDAVRLVDGELSHASLHAALEAGIDVNVSGLNPILLPFDRESEDPELVEFVVPVLYSFALDGRFEFTTEEMVAEIFGASWRFVILAEEAKRAVFRKLRDILRRAVNQELRGILVASASSGGGMGNHRWRLVESAVVRDVQAGLKQSFVNALAELQSAYIPTLRVQDVLPEEQ